MRCSAFCRMNDSAETRIQSASYTAQQEQNNEDDQDQPHEAAAPGEDVVAATIAVATAQQDDEQDYDQNQCDRTHGSLREIKDERAPAGRASRVVPPG